MRTRSAGEVLLDRCQGHGTDFVDPLDRYAHEETAP